MLLGYPLGSGGGRVITLNSSSLLLFLSFDITQVKLIFLLSEDIVNISISHGCFLETGEHILTFGTQV